MEAWVARVERSGEGEVERGGVVREKGEAEKGRLSKEGEGLGYGVPTRGTRGGDLGGCGWRLVGRWLLGRREARGGGVVERVEKEKDWARGEASAQGKGGEANVGGVVGGDGGAGERWWGGCQRALREMESRGWVW